MDARSRELTLLPRCRKLTWVWTRIWFSSYECINMWRRNWCQKCEILILREIFCYFIFALEKPGLSGLVGSSQHYITHEPQQLLLWKYLKPTRIRKWIDFKLEMVKSVFLTVSFLALLAVHIKDYEAVIGCFLKKCTLGVVVSFRFYVHMLLPIYEFIFCYKLNMWSVKDISIYWTGRVSWKRLLWCIMGNAESWFFFLAWPLPGTKWP